MAVVNKFPLIYEVNTRVWLRELSLKAGRALTLADVPEVEFCKWRELKVDIVWLMGVWEESAAARRIAQTHQGLWQEYQRALPDVELSDVGASPFAIKSYNVAQTLGGESALLKFRHRLNEKGMRLLLDFVPNHIARDCEWLNQHPNYFVAVPPHMAVYLSDSVVQHNGTYFACGKDPYFPAWTDTLQLNYANSALHVAMRETLRRIAKLCDGVRCDMAMLILKDVFNRTWGELGLEMKEEFWKKAIDELKSQFPNFL
ncbi:MAG: alpha-amylase family glycosyl hydrolase, partial [Candidatus Thermochlorobacter sp.]